MHRIRIACELHAEECRPAYATAEAAGADLRAFIEGPVTLQPGERRLIPTGVRLAIPPGFEGQVRPRSGLALTNGVTLLNSPGTVDSDYRGEVKVLLMNLGELPYTIHPFDRIAQLVVAPVARAEFATDAPLDSSERGGGGFGSTGR